MRNKNIESSHRSVFVNICSSIVLQCCQAEHSFEAKWSEIRSRRLGEKTFGNTVTRFFFFFTAFLFFQHLRYFVNLTKCYIYKLAS
jgi:hypothetical protein